ncbi:MAG: alpha/beta hydrolase [Flavobacteriales bacterium]
MKQITFNVQRTAFVPFLGDLSEETEFVWILLHGYRQSARDFLTLFSSEVTPYRCMIAPEGLSKFYSKGGDGPVVASWMTKENRAAEIEDYLAYLTNVLNYVVSKSPKAGIFLLGFSQGAATAARFFCQAESNLVNSLILWGGVFPPDIVFGYKAEAVARPIFLVKGSSDPYLQENIKLPEFANHAIQIVFEGGHELPSDEIRRITQHVENVYVDQAN